MGDRGARGGGALGLVIVVLLALQLLAHGGLLLARQERAASVAGLRVLQARMAAEGGVAAVSRRPLPDSLRRLPPLAHVQLGATPVGPHAARSALRRLDRELWLVEGEGQLAGEGWTWRSARLTWVVDPAARAAAGMSAVGRRTGASPDPPGTVVDPLFAATRTPHWCAPWAGAIDALRPRRASPAPSPTPDTTVGPRLGRLGPDALLALLPKGSEVSGSPSPAAQAGACADDPWNWGDPVDPSGPCAGRFVARAFPGDLEVEGGVGQGVVVVMGDLRMAGTVFEGLLLVGGDADISGDARVLGRLEVGGRLTLAPGSRVTASPCHVARGVHEAGSYLAVPNHVREVGKLEGW